MAIEMAQDVWYSCDLGYGTSFPQIMCRRGGTRLDRVDSDWPFGVDGEELGLLEKLNCYIPTTYVYSLEDIAQVEPVSMQLAEHCESLRDKPSCNW